jgi:hypothetical protein
MFRLISLWYPLRVLLPQGKRSQRGGPLALTRGYINFLDNWSPQRTQSFNLFATYNTFGNINEYG